MRGIRDGASGSPCSMTSSTSRSKTASISHFLDDSSQKGQKWENHTPLVEIITREVHPNNPEAKRRSGSFSDLAIRAVDALPVRFCSSSMRPAKLSSAYKLVRIPNVPEIFSTFKIRKMQTGDQGKKTDENLLCSVSKSPMSRKVMVVSGKGEERRLLPGERF